MDIWYLVADGTRARIFEARKRGGDICEIETYVNPEGRMPERTFYRDRAGRSVKGRGRRTSAQDRESRRELEEVGFAKQMAERLNEGFRDNEFERLAIVAAPKALGRIREHLNSRVKKVVVGSSSKNLTQTNREAIKQHLDRTIG